ncbi:MAG: hypothetical protein ACRDF4_04860 [Rhabdochlamydiaceae bacterium]
MTTSANSLTEDYKSHYKRPIINLPILLFVLGIVLIGSGFSLVVISIIGGSSHTSMSYLITGVGLFIAGIIPIVVSWKILS